VSNIVDLFSFERLINVFPKILPYLLVTLKIVLIGGIFGSLLGLLVAVVRINRTPVIYQILSVYISFMRGTPMLVQMMLLYYGLPLLLKATVGIDINGWEKLTFVELTFVELTFVINEAAFLGEMFRGAIEAVPYEQTEAAYSVGLNRVQAFVRIVLPQATKIVLPAFGTDIVGMFHNTQIAFLLGAMDMIGRAKTIGLSSGHSLEAYVCVAIIYIICSLLLRLIFNRLDRLFSYGRKEVGSIGI
jgi:L-cystine transport system permease protein